MKVFSHYLSPYNGSYPALSRFFSFSFEEPYSNGFLMISILCIMILNLSPIAIVTFLCPFFFVIFSPQAFIFLQDKDWTYKIENRGFLTFRKSLGSVQRP